MIWKLLQDWIEKTYDYICLNFLKNGAIASFFQNLRKLPRKYFYIRTRTTTLVEYSNKVSFLNSNSVKYLTIRDFTWSVGYHLPLEKWIREYADYVKCMVNYSKIDYFMVLAPAFSEVCP